jgi:uncharacterized membrane protein
MPGSMVLIHVAAGAVALAAGAWALLVRKGGRLHARTGTIFFGAMFVMTLTGALVAALRPERGTAVIGIFTCYLVATSWRTARRRDGKTGHFEIAAFVIACACAAAMLTFGLQAAASSTGRLDSLPASAHYPFAFLAALAAALDLNYILRRNVLRRQRIARHLWRVCTALLIAAFSFFIGQQKVMAPWMRGSPLLFLPEILIFGTMIFWLFRVRLSQRWNPRKKERGPLAVRAPFDRAEAPLAAE